MSSRFFLRQLAIAAIASFASFATAQSLAGRLVDGNGAPVVGATIILSNGAPSGTTDATGNFLITTLRNRVYTVQIDPRVTNLAPEQFDFTVNGASTLGTRTLAPGAAVTGTVLGPSGAGVLGANMNAYLPNGTKLFTPRDGTDINGNFLITVPLGDVRIRSVPPTGSNLIPYDQIHTFAGPLNLGTINLRQGLVVTGTVVDEISSVPISGVEFVTTNVITGEVVTQLNRTTNAFGAFSLLLPFGLYQFDVLPPLGNLHQARQLFNIAVIGAFNMGAVRMKRAVILSGQVLGPGGPVANADIDVYTDDGYKLYTPSDNTAANGVFAVLVPPGNYSVRVDPQLASGLVGAITNTFTVAANTNIGAINLSAGVAGTITVVDSNGQPVVGADMDFIHPTTGSMPVLSGDHSDQNGVIHSTVPTGVWNIRIDPPQGAACKGIAFNNVPVVQPVTLQVVLPPKPIRMNLTTTGVAALPQSGRVPCNFTFQNAAPVDVPLRLELVVQYPSGAETTVLPPLTVVLPSMPFPLTLGFWVPIPPVPQAQVGRVLKLLTRFRDPNTNTVLDEAYCDFVVGQ